MKNISGLDLGQEEEIDPDQMKDEGKEIECHLHWFDILAKEIIWCFVLHLSNNKQTMLWY